MSSFNLRSFKCLALYRICIIFEYLLLTILPVCAEKSFCFRVYLKDKGESSFIAHSPENFLSPESVEIRMLREVFVDETDFPISDRYISELKAVGVHVVVQSKWMKTVVVESLDSLIIGKLTDLYFVDSVRCVWNSEGRLDRLPCAEDSTRFVFDDEPDTTIYGYATTQIQMLNGIRLHETGNRGDGIRIAVIDAGFMNVDRIEAFSSMKLLGTHNVTFPLMSVFCDDNHGTKVLSCLAADLKGVMVGSAPEASYLLIKSEDIRSENPIEEDLWAAAVEYADSVGVDVITSSLGYYKFDSIPDYYSKEDLNGQTAFVSRVAKIAAQKGILMVNSAGNEGNNDWERIAFPADVQDVLTVGSITSDKEKSAFSSFGLTADYRIKPDVVALGNGVCVINDAGQIQYSHGTSFSTPVVAGLAACLWQAFPLLKNTELIQLIKETASQGQSPDSQIGYGIPDMFNAYKKANNDALSR